MRFSVERNTERFPNNAEVQLYNLAESTRNKLTEKPDNTVRIEAGYESAEQIFFGVLRRATVERQNEDIVTMLSAGDGEDKQTATISKSWATGTPISKILKDFVSALGLGLGNSLEFPFALTSYGSVLTKGLTISGPLTEEFHQFLRSLGLKYSIQDGTLQLLDIQNPVTKGVGPLVSPDTGLIGEARLDIDKDTKKTIVIGKALLLPDLVPGRSIKVQSNRVNGNFAVTKTNHYGDTHATEWYVDFEGIEI